MDVAITATIVMVVALVIILLMGAPIAVAIGMSSAMAMVVILPTNVALVTCAQKMFTGLNSFPLLAIPFFVLVWGRCWLALLRHSKFIAIHVHASASAKAWWCFVRSYPKYAATVGSLWLGRMLPSLRRAALQVQ